MPFARLDASSASTQEGRRRPLRNAKATFAREAGGMPARSRHCMRGAAQTTVRTDGKAGHRQRSASQDTVANAVPRSASRQGKDCDVPINRCGGCRRRSVALADTVGSSADRARRNERSRPRIGRAHRTYHLRGHRRGDSERRRPHRRRCHRKRSRRQRRSLRCLRRRRNRRHSRQFGVADSRARRRRADRRRPNRLAQFRAILRHWG